MASEAGETFRFRDFELDVGAYELRRRGRPVRLERQPMDLLILLVERRGRLVSRREIIERLWSDGVFVAVETSVNTAIRKVRQALRDSPEAPVCIETVPGRGYRFFAAVEVLPAPYARLRLAVLPFENLSGDPEREYLAEGLTEETIVSLGQIDPDHLHVIGRTSSAAYKGNRKAIAAIGEELKVDYVVESSIRAEGRRLRVVSKLIRAHDQVQVWSASYDREPTSMLGVQQELSTAIAEQIRLRLSPDRLKAVARRHTQNPDAYDLFLRGRRLWNQLTPATTRRAVDHYRRAIQLDPDYALAWSALADAYASSPMNGDAPPAKMWSLARDAASEAVRAEPALAEAQASLGAVEFMLGWDWQASEAALRRAIDLDPNYAWAHLVLGHLLSQSGRHAAAWRMMRRCCELDPLSAVNHSISSQVAFQARDHSAAVEHARQAIVIDPEFWVGYMQRGQAYEQLGESALAFEALTTAARLSGGNSKPISLRGYMLAKLGQTREAREVLNMLKTVLRERYVPPYAMALIYAGLGEHDEVFESLNTAYATRDVHLVFLTVDPKWNPYRADPRFDALLVRCGFRHMDALRQ
jgi:TolB-like protein/Tfp pilus assembly protein PilF